MKITQLDEITSFIRSQNHRGCALLLIVVPAANPEDMLSPQNVSVYGNYGDVKEQVRVMRQVADKIEASVESESTVHEQLPTVN